MTKEQPTFVFVPGSWHTPAHFAPLISALAKHQLPSNCVSLPSNSTTSSKDVELKHDVAAVREAVEKLVVKEEKEVLVVMHSSGGMVGSDALLGLSLKERSQLGRRGGVVRLVYIAALIFPEGTQVAPRDDLSKVPSWAQIDENVSSSFLPLLNAHSSCICFCSDSYIIADKIPHSGPVRGCKHLL